MAQISWGKPTAGWKLGCLMCLLKWWFHIFLTTTHSEKEFYVRSHTMHSHMYTHIHTHKNLPCNPNWSHVWLWEARNESLNGNGLENVTTSVWFLIWTVRTWEGGERLRWECHKTLNILTHWDVLRHLLFFPILSFKIVEWNPIIDFIAQLVYITVINYC